MSQSKTNLIRITLWGLLIIIVISLCISQIMGCGQINDLEEQNSIANIYPTEKSTAVETVVNPKNTVTPTIDNHIRFGPTPENTLRSFEEQRLLANINNHNCVLPCFFGIIPGKTTIKEAREKISDIGGTFIGVVDNQTHLLYEYDFEIGGEVTSEDTVFLEDGSIRTFTFNIGLITDDEIVQGLYLGGGTWGLQNPTNQSIEITKLFSNRFKTQTIFKELGKPDQVYISKPNIKAASLIALIYEGKGIMVEVLGPEEINNVCFIDGQPTLIYFDVYLINNQSTIDFTPYGYLFPTVSDDWMPIKEVINMGEEEFYDHVIENENFCAQIGL